MRRRGYVAASLPSENARGSSVRAASSATQSPTAGASISSAAARAISLSTASRSSDAAMSPDRRVRPRSRASRRSAASFSRRRRSISESGVTRAPIASPADISTRAPRIRSARTGTRPPRPPPVRRPGSSADGRGPPGSYRRGFAHPPATISGAASIPPGNFGVGARQCSLGYSGPAGRRSDGLRPVGSRARSRRGVPQDGERVTTPDARCQTARGSHAASPAAAPGRRLGRN